MGLKTHLSFEIDQVAAESSRSCHAGILLLMGFYRASGVAGIVDARVW